MQIITFTIEDIATLTKVQTKLSTRKRLSSKERGTLDNLLTGLPPTETLLREKIALDETFGIKLLDIDEMWPHLEKWISLFNNLPKKTSALGVHASWIDSDVDSVLSQSNVIIVVSFIPSLAYSRRKKGMSFYLHLKTDGTATFEFSFFKDAALFAELYNFKGSWRESYLMTIKTLQKGWPQTIFPPEFEPLLKK